MPVTEVQPERKSAPGSLELVRNFVNSVDYEDQEEDFGTPEELREWLVGHDLLDPAAKVGPADLRRALDVREGLRALLLANNGAVLDGEKVERLDKVARRSAVQLRFPSGSDPRLEPGSDGVDGALAQLLALVAVSVADGSWSRMKACIHETCLFAFYDKSKNHSKRWCRMETCGNIHKARAFRARRR